MFEMVATANTDKMPITTMTTTVWTRATAWDPTMLSRVMAPITRTAKTLIHAVLPWASDELA